jgi:hypothetical protein
LQKRDSSLLSKQKRDDYQKRGSGVRVQEFRVQEEEVQRLAVIPVETGIQ